ncbi:hypothetical protein FQA47_004990 [Oryzias melastigma]|uniref:Uncharacterized protein n=1 Tax=Oryzias melastigma TaxID=30732 RepID=A0A834FSH6_ORYME|nr:hypothetical protein FQA47_004990 [Oryzias melastigma]
MTHILPCYITTVVLQCLSLYPSDSISQEAYHDSMCGSVKRDSLENGRAIEGGGEGAREIVWKRREEVVAQERAEALERQRLAEYIVWRRREDFQDKKGDREKGGKSAEKGKEASPEVIWKRREDEEGDAGRERAKAIQRGHEIIWRKRERE